MSMASPLACSLGTAPGFSYLARQENADTLSICASCIRAGSRGRFFTTADVVNQLEAEARAGRQSRIADCLTRLDFVILDELDAAGFKDGLKVKESRMIVRPSPFLFNLAKPNKPDW
jgi:hypothetical protein